MSVSTSQAADIPPTYYHQAAPDGFPRPWWYQAMAYLWWRIGMDMLAGCPRPEQLARIEEDYFPASGGGAPIKMCPYHSWNRADRCYLK